MAYERVTESHERVRPAMRAARPVEATGRGLLALQRTAGNRAVAQLIRSAPPAPAGGPVVQREAAVDKDPKMLDFMITRMGDQLKASFVNATDEQITTAVRLVDGWWRAKYLADKKKLTKTTAGGAMDKKALLQALGKTGAALESKDSYIILNSALTSTFADEATHIFNFKPAKLAKMVLGAVPALDILKENGEILPEDKTGDGRLKTCTENNIVKTGADTPATATALYTLDNSANDNRVEDKGKSWELHAHVTQAGEVDFAHTKADGAHAFVATDWFDKNIEESEREWS